MVYRIERRINGSVSAISNRANTAPFRPIQHRALLETETLPPLAALPECSNLMFVVSRLMMRKSPPYQQTETFNICHHHRMSDYSTAAALYCANRVYCVQARIKKPQSASRFQAWWNNAIGDTHISVFLPPHR